jgi:hypothetical protein
MRLGFYCCSKKVLEDIGSKESVGNVSHRKYSKYSPGSSENNDGSLSGTQSNPAQKMFLCFHAKVSAFS